MNISNIVFQNEVIYTNKSLDFEVTGIVADSREVYDNCIFVAIKGENRDGNDHIKEALIKGARIIISEFYQEESVPHIVVKNARSEYSKMLSRWYDNPTKDMKVIAVTGTNGKTTTSYYLYNIMKKAKKKSGLISTVECIIDGEKIELNGGGEVKDICSAMTTPDPKILYEILYKMKKRGIEYLIIEASSHALKQRRLDGIDIDVAIFTNMSCEHLDYHKTMDDYYNSKLLLFEKAKKGVINTDNEYGKQLSLKYEHMHRISYDKQEEYRILDLKVSENGTKFIFSLPEQDLELSTDMIGDYNAINASLAACASKLCNIENSAIVDGIKETKVSGRMEKVGENIFIDYAHTPYATKMVLENLKFSLNYEKMIVIFGCGGERDKSKRAEIGNIVSKYADITIITSDNSRKEEPLDIIKDILRGIECNKAHLIIPNRKNAILFAIKHLLKDNNILILLGKGHENYQIDRNGKHYFSEKDIIEEALRNVRY